MTDLPGSTEKSNLTSQLKGLLRQAAENIDSVSEDEQKRLLEVLEDMQTSDPREHSRKPCSLEVTYSTETQVFTDFVKNISSGGVFIDTPAAFAAGEEITMTFSSPGEEEPIKVTGEIVRNVPGGLGVRFKTVSKSLKDLVEAI